MTGLGCMLNKINHPAHYNAHPSGVECIEITEHMNFCIGNAMKYLWRAEHKENTVADLRKAIWYIEREIHRLKSTETVKAIDVLVKPIAKGE